MAEASRAFCEQPTRRGLCLGILKGETSRRIQEGREVLTHFASEPNPWVEVPIRTHLPLSGLGGRDLASRNHLNVLSSDVLLALPGEAGTLSEVTLRLDYGLSMILFLGPYGISGLPAWHFQGLARAEGQVRSAGSPEELEVFLRQALEHSRQAGHGRPGRLAFGCPSGAEAEGGEKPGTG